MTLLQKFKELHPELDADRAIVKNCPEDFELEDDISFDKCDKMNWNCTSCWNREYEDKANES